MGTVNKSPGGWQRVALFEIDAHAAIIGELRGSAPDTHHLIIPARESPPGLRRYEIYVDFAIGDVQAMRVAQAQMQTVQKWVVAGLMPGYRIVDSCLEPDSGNALRRAEWRLRDVSHARDLN